MVRAVLPAGIELIPLQIRSANKWLDPELPSLKGKLIGVVSSWVDFTRDCADDAGGGGSGSGSAGSAQSDASRAGSADWTKQVRSSAMRIRRQRASCQRGRGCLYFRCWPMRSRVELSKFSDSSQFL